MTDEERESHGEVPRELRRDDQMPVREFLVGIIAGVALLIPGCILSGFAVLGSYGVVAMSADRVSPLDYVLTGEQNVFLNQGIKPRHAFNPFENEWGAWVLAARWSTVSTTANPT